MFIEKIKISIISYFNFDLMKIIIVYEKIDSKSKNIQSQIFSGSYIIYIMNSTIFVSSVGESVPEISNVESN